MPARNLGCGAAMGNKAEKSDFTTSDTTDPEEDEIINVAVFGTDEDGVRADVNMVASFNTGTKELHFISVPRDSKVIMTKEMTDYLESKNAYVPEQNGVYGQCKLTELHAMQAKITAVHSPLPCWRKSSA